MGSLRSHLKWNSGPLPWHVSLVFLVGEGVPLVTGMVTDHLALGAVGAFTTIIVLLSDAGGRFASRSAQLLITPVVLAAMALIGAATSDPPWHSSVMLLVFAVIVGWLHNTHNGIEAVARFGAVWFLIGAAAHSFPRGNVLVTLLVGPWTVFLMWAERRIFGGTSAAAAGLYRKAVAQMMRRETAGMQFAVLYGVAAVAAVACARALGAEWARWAGITVLMVMRPDGGLAYARSVQRLVGTFLGVLVAAVILRSPNMQWLALCALMMGGVLPLGRVRNYWVVSLVLAVHALVLARMAGIGRSIDHLWIERLESVAIGCGVAFVATTLASRLPWPGACGTPSGDGASEREREGD